MTFRDITFPENLALGAEGGPEWLVQISRQLSGHERRNVAQDVPLHRYNVSLVNREVSEIKEAAVFMRVVYGRGDTFRFPDFFDFEVPDEHGTGILGTTGLGTGEPDYQLYKSYLYGGVTVVRAVVLPRNNSVFAVERDGYPVTLATSPANPSEADVNYSTGTVTFAPDASSPVVSVTAGATTAVELDGPVDLSVGQLLYLQGMNGTAGTVLNGSAWEVLSIGSPDGSYVIDADTSGTTWTSGGTGEKHVQATETLTWRGEFDVLCRFDTDRMRARVVVGGPYQNRRGTWDSIELVEVRTP